MNGERERRSPAGEEGAERVAGIVLAAGGGRRFGGAKQLATLGSVPLLARVVAAACTAPELTRVVVTLGARAERIAAAIDLGRAETVVVPDWESGLSASLRAGVAAVGDDVDAVAIVLGDNPLLDPATIGRVVRARGDAPAARAVHDGRPGHPVVLGRELLARVGALRGDAGAGPLLREAAVVEVECGPACVADVDTPAQLAALDARLRGG